VIVGSLLPVLAEAVRLAEAAGVDAAALPEALRGGWADSIPLQVFVPRMAARAWEPPLGAADTMLKDLDGALALAREAGVTPPRRQDAAQRYRLLGAQGLGGHEPSALMTLLEAPRGRRAGDDDARVMARRSRVLRPPCSAPAGG